jgi:glycosyltransferase involved in cell wall biosynthesis
MVIANEYIKHVIHNLVRSHMKILFVTHWYPNYVPDLLLHGLRKLLGPDVVDYPRKDCLYDGVLGLGVCPDDQRCPGWFPDDSGSIDREDIWLKVRKGHFDLLVCDARAWPLMAQNTEGCNARMAILDGEDIPLKIPVDNYLIFRRETDGWDFSIPLPMALPEEVFNWIVRYDALPKKHTIGFLGSTHDGQRKQLVDQLSRWYPDSLFQVTTIPGGGNPVPDGRLGRDGYYRCLQQCRVVLTLPGAGLDTFRFWENAACNSIHASPRMPLMIPADFKDGKHILRFDSIDDLHSRLDRLLEGADSSESMIPMARHHLINHHLTQHRARYFLDKVRQSYEAADVFAQVQRRSAPPTAKRPSSKSVYLGLIRGDGYGWGVCSRYLIQELSEVLDVHVLNSEDGSASNDRLDGPLFQGLANHEFLPLFDKARGNPNYAYTFFENELTAKSVENARRYDLVLGGSSWCRDRMLEKGIRNCDILIQGVDTGLFYPVQRQPPEDRFVIFSGGKFELRKGQDLVLRALKILQEKYADIWLVNCWYNLWPASTRLMEYSRHIRFKFQDGESWQQMMRRTYQENGLDPDRIITCDLLAQQKQRDLFAQTHVGVFPNRCEGGTNLVLMEYMACARPVIASHTSGHKDVLTPQNAIRMTHMQNFNLVGSDGALAGRWQEPSLDELVAHIEYAYHHRDEIRQIGSRAGEDMKQFTWKHSARRLIRLMGLDGG